VTDDQKKHAAAVREKLGANVLTADAILEINDLKIEKVLVPEWGGCVYVRGMSGNERDQWEQAILETSPGERMENIRGLAGSYSICDKDGKRLFTDHQVEALGKKSAAALDRVFAVAKRLSRLSVDDIEELTKN